MARKRIEDQPTLKTWADVDRNLMKIAENEIAIENIVGEMNKQSNGIKMIADQEAQPHHDQISKLEKEIKEFVEEHREDLGKKKTKDLTFGQCGFRLSTSVGLPKGAEKLAEMIKKLRSRKMTECVVTTEKVDKEALKKYGKDIVTAVGATWKQKDTFWYDVNKETLERAEKGAV